MQYFFAFLFCVSFGTSLIFPQAVVSETEKLALTAQIWGFLKYYHPQVAQGAYNWDQQLLDFLPKLNTANNSEQLSQLYLDWLDQLGPVSKCRRCQSKEVFFDKNFDLSWLRETEEFSPELVQKLNFIEQNRYQGDQYYVSTEAVGKIKILNEAAYQEMGFPDESYRLLGMFRYWNIIEYFFPYKYLMDQEWRAVLREMIPVFQQARTQEAYQAAIQNLVARLDDSHAWISLDQTRSMYLPIKVKRIDQQAVIAGFYDKALAEEQDLRMGDIILEINGTSLQKESERKIRSMAISNETIGWSMAYHRVIHGPDSLALLKIQRKEELLHIKARRYPFEAFDYRQGQFRPSFPQESVGYIDMSVFKREDIALMWESYQDSKALIIDLRNYPAMIYGQVSRHLNSRRRPFANIYSPHPDYPGRFRYKARLRTGGKNKKAYKGRVILLVDESSMSRSEFTAMAFQTADTVLTVGSQTAGADGDVVVFEYMGGYRTAMSGNGVLYPDGGETQRRGIRVDVEVHPSIEGLRQGEDEVLEKALEVAQNDRFWHKKQIESKQ
ncbi:MAG: S41 family peptidase [Bacteroidota bacterium]